MGTRIVALLAVLVALGLGVRQQLYQSCIGDVQRVSAKRTSEIARATDVERQAQRALISNMDPARTRALKAAALAAYDATDRVRAANPPPPAGGC